MSADNAVVVLRKTQVQSDSSLSYEYYVTDQCASVAEEDCQYTGHIVCVKHVRSEALEAAHNYADTLPILEYGVSEGIYPDPKPCGRCYVCLTERNEIADDIERCDYCLGPFSNSDWRVSTYAGTFHRHCKPERR